MALALHELATNAVKHGALRLPSGTVAVLWNEAHDREGRRHMTLMWKERGGPPVETPRRTGFGSRLIARTFGQDSGGSASIHYDPDGLRCVAQVPLNEPESRGILDIGNP